MNFYIQQSIQINLIKIGSITNSSVLQIGSAGVIRPSSNLFNTGGFIKPAPATEKPGGGGISVGGVGSGAQSSLTAPAVPLSL
ncbi:MAG TPA: spore germination protein GerPB [Pseudoneobacillus sp.]|nr:spore germination protein GerPB [Pseudoneobacillus sp.]